MLSDLSFALQTHTLKMQRLAAGPIIRRITDLFSNKTGINGTVDERRLTLLSGHDSTLAAVLNALGLFRPPRQTPYSSALIFELREDDNDAFQVRILFRNSTASEPVALALEGCSTSCPLQKFLALTLPVSPTEKEWTKECRVIAGTGGN